MRRSPRQTLIAMAAVLGGLWLGLYFLQRERARDTSELPSQLPDIELIDLSPEALYARDDFQPHANAPKSWDSISLRMYADLGGIYTRFLRCTIDADEVVSTNRDLFAVAIPRWRTGDDRPPRWWPGWPQAGLNLKPDHTASATQSADQATAPVRDPWAVPDWFDPSGGTGIWWMLPDEDRAIGHYLHYNPDTRIMHLWEWRRWHGDLNDPQAAALRELSTQPLIDQLASALVASLLQARHPTLAERWLHATDRYPGDLPGITDIDRERLAPVSTIDALLHPHENMRFVLRLQGVPPELAHSLVQELPMRPLPDDSPIPRSRWDFALPPGQDGKAWLPSWFQPGAGPRWAYTVVRPGSGAVESARWIAYDTAQQQLFIWDWRQNPGDLTTAQPPSTDLLAK